MKKFFPQRGKTSSQGNLHVQHVHSIYGTAVWRTWEHVHHQVQVQANVGKPDGE